MLIKKLIPTLLFSCSIVVTTSSFFSLADTIEDDEPFFKNDQRAEIFKITDNEVPVFRITMPEEDYSTLLEKANYPDILNFRINVTDYLQRLGTCLEQIVLAFEEVDYNEKFDEPAKVLPELNIDEEGHAHINVEEVISGFDLDPNNFRDFDFVHNNILLYVLGSNANFNIFKLTPMVGINIGAIDMDPEFKLNFAIFLGGVENDDSVLSSDFKTKQATLEVEINNEVKSFKKVTFSLSGNLSRTRSKLNYNLKIRGKDELYGRKTFKLRSDDVEPTFLRSKIVSDIHNRLELPSISANYAELYVNDQYMGFYILVDTLKTSWVEYVYGEKDTTSLFQCKDISSFLSESTSSNACENECEDDQTPDTEGWINLLKRLDKAHSAEDIEDIFDVDQFLYEMALEYLTAGWDHLVHNGHNYYMYKNVKTGKWEYLAYDFDLDLGQNIDRIFLSFITEDMPERIENFNRDYPNYSIQEWISSPFHLVEILILNDPTRFNQILANVIEKAFNPAVLFPHIDEIKSFIEPYVMKDKIPDTNGLLPGRINHLANSFFSVEEWNANSEFTTVPTYPYCAYGIKYWILAKYRNVCKTYNLNCDPTYMDENYKFPINEEVEFKGYFPDHNNDDPDEPQPTDEPPVIVPTTTTAAPTPTPTVHYKCMAESIGYPCCSPLNKFVVRHDKYGDWGYDIFKRMHCGISPYVPPPPPPPPKPKCWTEKYGYPCCEDCRVIRIGLLGRWGYDFRRKKWCGISYHCH